MYIEVRTFFGLPSPASGLRYYSMRIVIAPDKFKGSLTAAEVCRVIARGVRRADAHAEVVSIPLADGGEGTLDLLVSHLNLEVVRLTVNDPLFRPVEAYYGKKGAVAYVEMAQASGLALLAAEERDALRTTSYGTGELIRHAVEHGATEVYVLIGGSASNDAGIGIAQSLGYRFLGTDRRTLSPVGESLAHVASIDSTNRLSTLDQVSVRVISDVNNPLYGPQGAAQVYAPQKGASPEAVARLDQGLMNIANRMRELTGKDVHSVPGAGAAGGVGAGALAFLSAELLPGIHTLIDLCGVRPAIQRADLVISGEGKVDAQTLHGKVVKGVSEVCQGYNVPLGVICGTLEADEATLQRLGVWRAYAVREAGMSLAEAMKRTEERMEALAYRMMKEVKELRKL